MASLPYSQVWLAFLFLLVFGCTHKKTELHIYPFQSYGWPAAQPVCLQYHIEPAGETWNFLYQIQYDEQMPFQNIWLKYQLISPDGDTLAQSVDNLFLFEPNTGKPMGNGVKIRQYRNAYFLKNVRLANPGKYEIRLWHYMRTDSLRGIQAIGVQTEPAA